MDGTKTWTQILLEWVRIKYFDFFHQWPHFMNFYNIFYAHRQTVRDFSIEPFIRSTKAISMHSFRRIEKA